MLLTAYVKQAADGKAELQWRPPLWGEEKSPLQVDVPEMMTEIMFYSCKSNHLQILNSMNACGCVYQRDKSKGSKVTAVKEKGKLKRWEKRKALKEEKYIDGAENRGEQSIANCVPYGCLDRPAS